MDFIFAPLKTQRAFDVVCVVFNRFFKIAHFMPHKNINDVAYYVELFFKEVV
jgi:hypothetical protein